MSSKSSSGSSSSDAATTPSDSSEIIARKPISMTAQMVLNSIVTGPPESTNSAFRSVFHRLLPPNLREFSREVQDRSKTVIGLAWWRRLRRAVMSVIFSPMRFLFSLQAEAWQLHIMFRKKFVYDEVTSAIKNGAKQVIIMGAGFDVLCLQLAKKNPEVLFIEIDQPNTQVVKKKIIDDIYAIDGPRPQNHAFVSVDFRYQTIEGQLKSFGRWKNDVTCVAVSEGLWPYLTTKEISYSLQEFRRISCPGSKLVFNYYLQMPNVPWVFKALIKFILWFSTEPMKWEPKTTSEVKDLVATQGYDVDVSEANTDCYKRYIVKKGYDRFVKDSNRYKNFMGTAVTKS